VQGAFTLSTNATFFSGSFSQGSFTQNAGVLTWNIGSLPSHASATGAVLVFPAAVGSVAASVTLSEAETDANPADNATNISTTVPSSTFEHNGDMILARYAHTATLLPNGQVLIAGGITTTGTTSMVELYDPTTGNSAAAGNLTIPRANHTATLLNDGRVFFAGNTNAEIYDPATMLSAQTANMITTRTYGHTAILLANGRVLLAGGYIYFYSTPATEIFDPVSGTFASAPDMRWSRYYHTATRLSDNSIFIAGGQDVYYWDYMECDIFSPDGLSKRTTAYMFPALQAGASLLSDGRVLISGGWKTLDDALVFSPVTNGFASTGKVYDHRWRHICLALTNGTVLICAGANGGPGSALRSAELFSPASGTFARTTDLIEPRDYPAGVALPDGRVLVTGGFATASTGDVYLASVEVYNPSTAKAPPLILAQNAAAAEDGGSLQFQLQLSAPMGVPVSVNYSTADSSAAAGADYIATNGTAVFPPGVTNVSVSVALVADTDYEPDETFYLNLANATNAFLGVQQVIGAILNDDPQPTVSAQPSTIAEGNAYTNFITFNVALNAKSYESITVDYFTSDGTAVAGVNYYATNGTLSFGPGVTTQTVTVVTVSDITPGPDRVFYLNLTNASNASIGATHVAGTILNDDGIAGAIDHFDFAPINSPQRNHVPFPLSITARDAFGQTVTNFSGGVTVWGSLTNTPWQEFNFEEGDFSQWTPLNLGNSPGPYQISLFDMTGHGILSRAFRLAANSGPADGISRSINLLGGVTYYISVDLAAYNANGGFANGDASTAHMLMNSVEIGTVNFNVFGQINALQTFRTNLLAVYTPTATGAYTLSFRFDRGYLESDVWSYVDNVRISTAYVPPAWVATFTNGTWSGNFQINSNMQRVALVAEDVPGHQGGSSAFDVASAANLRISYTNSPTLVRAGSDVALSLTVSNLGPDTAGNVLMTNRVSGDITFRSASSSQGATLTSGAVSAFNLGSIAGGQKATVTVTINPHSLGYFTNTASVVSDQFDPDSTNNVTQVAVLANPVLVHANSASFTEGNSGTNNAPMALWLEGPVGETISVSYATASGTASSGVDYKDVAGNVIFGPNSLTQFVNIPVIGDLIKEPNETVLLNLAAVSTNASLATTQTTLTIIDDDPTPSISIANIALFEGNSGTTNAVFQITLSNPSASIVSVQASTSDGTALASNDYLARSGSVTFAVGTTNQAFIVPVVGDVNNEPDQVFFVTLTNSINGTVTRAVATCTIINDDAVPGLLHHFAWDPIPPVRYKDWPFPVVLRALDHLNQPATNGLSTAMVTVRTDSLTNLFSVSPSNFNSFANGVKSNLIVISGAATNVYLTADDGLEHVGTSGYFTLLTVPLSLTTTSSVTEGSAPVPALVSIPVSFPQPITVTLTSTIPARLSVPASVLIAANQSNAPFNLTVIDDGLLNGTELASVIASVTNFISATNVIAVQDNEPAVLTLTLPATASENVGTLAGQGHVTSSAPPSKPVSVTLVSSDTNVVQVPGSVIIQSNQTTATFDIVIVNNQRLDGSHTATVSTTVANWTNDSKMITVTDDETNTLRISSPAIVNEGTTASVSVFLTGSLNTNLSISLSSGNSNALVVQTTSVVSAGQTSAVFTVSAPDNSLFDGTRTVTITATAPGFISNTTNVSVTDNDLHHFNFGAIPSPQQGGVGFNVAITARDVNDVLMASYVATVSLAASDGSNNPVPLVPTPAGFVNGQWSGTVTIPTWEFQNVRIIATAPGGRSTPSSPFDVVPPTVSIIPLQASDVAYSATTRLLYASVTNSGLLQEINPFNASLGSTISIPTLSGQLCAGDGGQYIFAALNGSFNHICEVDVNSQSVVNAWSLDGTYVEDMAPVLGSPMAVAVSRKALGTSPRFRGVLIYDDGLPRSNSNNGFLGSNVIEAGPMPGRLYGYNSETSPAGMQIMNVDASGITVVGGWGGVPPFAGDIYCRGGWLFATWGAIYDPERGIQVGSYGGQVADDAASGRYYLLSPGSLVAFDQNTLLPVGTTTLPGVTGVGANIVRWGTNGFAFRMNGSQCAIVRTPLVSSGASADLKLSMKHPLSPAAPSNTLTYAFTISNQGPATARNVVLTQTLPGNSSFASANSSSGTAGLSGGGVVAALGSISVGGTATVTVKLQTFLPGLLTSVASVTSDSFDPGLSNNVLHVDVPVAATLAMDTVTELSLPTTDLTWDRISKLIFASVPNSDWLRGNTIVPLDPLSGKMESRIPTAIEPARLVAADDGSFLYTGINNDNSIQRINLASRSADLKFPTGFSYAADLGVLPGTPDSVAATVNTTFAVYDHGVVRPHTVDPGPYNFEYYLALSATNTLAYEAAPYELRRIGIDSSGATMLSSSGLINGFDRSIKFDSGRLYTAGGRIIDPEAGIVITNLPYSGLACPDSASGKVFYLTYSGSVGALHSVDLTNFVETGSIGISNIQGNPSSLIRWGNDGLAFRTSAGQVFLIRTTFADDRDNDGLGDSWELAHFGSLNAPNGNPGDDPDHDGFTNLEEYRLGLDPLVYDAPRLLSCKVRADGSVQLTALVSTATTYALLASANLADWIPIQTFTGSNSLVTLTDFDAINFQKRFYRFAPLSEAIRPHISMKPGLPPGNGFDLQVSGVPGYSYRIEISPDLINWNVATNFVITNGLFDFHDSSQGTPSSRKFYRAASN
jgi:uncharacterized repeat protein (TIGR01451 family)